MAKEFTKKGEKPDNEEGWHVIMLKDDDIKKKGLLHKLIGEVQADNILSLHIFWSKYFRG